MRQPPRRQSHVPPPSKCPQSSRRPSGEASVVTRLFALLRSALWQNLELRSLLEVYGTAGGGRRFLGTPQQAFLAGFG